MKQTRGADVLKAWVVYFALKCAVVILAMLIGERLGFIVFSIEKGPSPKEDVALAWLALVVCYAVVAVIAAFIFRWAVGRFVVSRMGQEAPAHLGLFLYCRTWVIYASITFVGGYLIALPLDYAIFELALGGFADASWPEWLRPFLQPIVFTLLSLFIFRWAVIKLLLADRTALASPKARVM